MIWEVCVDGSLILAGAFVLFLLAFLSGWRSGRGRW